MEESIGMSDFRDNIRDHIDLVQQGDTRLVERYGKPTAAVIPVELYNQLRQSREQFRQVLDTIRNQAELSKEEAMEVALEEQQSARRDSK